MRPIKWPSPDRDFQLLEYYENKFLDTPLWELTEYDFMQAQDCIERCGEKSNTAEAIHRLCEMYDFFAVLYAEWQDKMGNPDKRQQMMVRRQETFKWHEISDQLFLKRNGMRMPD